MSVWTPEIDDVDPLEYITTTWGNQIRDQVVHVLAAPPLPVDAEPGALCYLASVQQLWMRGSTAWMQVVADNVTESPTAPPTPDAGDFWVQSEQVDPAYFYHRASKSDDFDLDSYSVLNFTLRGGGVLWVGIATSGIGVDAPVPTLSLPGATFTLVRTTGPTPGGNWRLSLFYSQDYPQAASIDLTVTFGGLTQRAFIVTVDEQIPGFRDGSPVVQSNHAITASTASTGTTLTPGGTGALYAVAFENTGSTDDVPSSGIELTDIAGSSLPIPTIVAWWDTATVASPSVTWATPASQQAIIAVESTAVLAHPVYIYDGAEWIAVAPAPSGAVRLDPPTIGGVYEGNQAIPPPSWQGETGTPWLEIQQPYSADDDNPDTIITWATTVFGNRVKTGWFNGNGEPRAAPSLPNRVAFRAFEMIAPHGPSTGRFFELSTNPLDAAEREPLLGAYGTGHATQPGWVVATRVLAGAMGVRAGGDYNGLTALNIRGLKTGTGPPSSGTWVAGDMVVDSAGDWHLCSVAGTPGTWV